MLVLLTTLTTLAGPTLLQTGLQPAEIAPPEVEGVWLALVPGGDRVERVEVRTAEVFDRMEPGTDWREITALLNGTPVGPALLLRDVPGVTAGPVTALIDGPVPLVAGGWMVLGSDREAVTVIGLDGPDGLGLDPFDEPVHTLQIHRLPVESCDGCVQRQLGVPGLGDLTEEVVVLWAGDLDGDGRADAAIEAPTAWGSVTALLLSSAATDGDLLGVAAILEIAGC